MRRHCRWVEYGLVLVGLVASQMLATVVGAWLGGGTVDVPFAVRVVGAWTVPEARAQGDRVGGVDAAPRVGSGPPKPIADIMAAGGKVVSLGEREGLEAFLVVPPGGKAYTLYLLESGSVVVGLLLGADGANLTAVQLQEAHAAGKLEGMDGLVAASRAVEEVPADRGTRGISELFEATRVASGFWMGDRGPELHTFVDPTCPYSVEHVRLLGRDAAAGRLRAHVIPIGVLGALGVREAVEVAGAADPRARWEGADGGAIDEALGAARVVANRRVHGGWRVRGVPFTVWMGRDDVRVFYGAGEASSYAREVLAGS